MIHPLRHALGSGIATRHLMRGARGLLVVLGYHDLRSSDDLRSWMRVDVGTFAEHMEALGRIGGFVAPSDIDRPEAFPAGTVRFLVTFDDGYANHLLLGAPVLESTNVPALFFISTHHMVTGEPFWFDRVVIPIQAAHLRRLDLSRFGLCEYRFSSVDDGRRWEGIQQLLADLKRIGNAGAPRVASVLEYLESEFGGASSLDARSGRPISVDEVKRLARCSHMHFGSHAHRHDVLTRLDDGDLADALDTSMRVLRQTVGTPIEDIAYPNGTHDQRILDASRSAGYRRGYTAAPGPAFTNPMRIPRLLVGGYDAAHDLLAAVNRLLLANRLAHA